VLSISLVQASAFNVDDIVITDILYRDLKPDAGTGNISRYTAPLSQNPRASQSKGTLQNLKIYKILEVDNCRSIRRSSWDKDIAQFHHLTKLNLQTL